MADIRRRDLAKAVWIPLRASHAIERTGKFGYVGFKEDFYGAGSLAVPVTNKGDGLKLGWDSIGFGHDQSGYVEDGRYVPSDVYEPYQHGFTGLRLALHQRGGAGEKAEWHLHQDLVITLGLKREGDVWVRPDEDYVEVARLVRGEEGGVVRLEVRASHLRDYLCARQMGLVVSSYRDRSAVLEDVGHIAWASDYSEQKEEHAKWVGSKTQIRRRRACTVRECMSSMWHGRMLIRKTTFRLWACRPMESSSRVRGRVNSVDGNCIEYRVSYGGRSGSTPHHKALSVRGDKVASTVSFIIDAEGKQVLSDTLRDSGRWLWFKPTVISALISKRSGSLKMYTRDTGGIELSGHSVHFGVNSIGLITVYAKDIALLPEWQQRIWAAHNVGPEGKVSEELQASQVHAEPARTKAPEPFLEKGLARLQALGTKKLGIKIFRVHDYVTEVLPQIHRFRATDKQGLYSLAKDVARVIADDIDEKQLQTLAVPPKGEKWASLKSLEKVLATRVDPDKARAMLGPLVGIYELRLADAHLPAKDLEDAIRLVGIDESAPPVMQGLQLLHAAVSSIYAICEVIEKQWS